jgi:hypothetical protein
LLVIADSKTGIMLHYNVMLPEDDEIQQILDFFIDFILDKGRPKTIYVRDEYMQDLLSDLCKKINTKILISEELPSIDTFAESIIRQL